jgi:hypothetical protein
MIPSCGGEAGSSSGYHPSIKYAGPFLYTQRLLDVEDWVDSTAEIQVLITNSSYVFEAAIR